MVRESEIRDGESAVALPSGYDAEIYFIGRIRTPWDSRLLTPRQGRADGPVCHIEIFEPWADALEGVLQFARLEVLYWLHLSRRDLVRQSPSNDGAARGTFSLRSPVRPNPIGTQIVELVALDGNVLAVRGMDCLDGTPLIDIKPDRTLFNPIAPSQPGDFQTG
ncbi:tRNA-Thr(GGU) m(6)t(6)A37 methyltransferase TsaA [Aminobacter aminovorans]|uniref:Putative methyltransferase, YaeB/AF_0241 family n=1 Tax=Aminobacter aminovorans TaxID=83263 RepID=A0A380WRG2_AMIAI|nr:tRNA (N6-threonylcarbamoyladenosine(37)-N6)-methyltransferase TrmO [Aminobacter aminovorans]TCS20393.1 tRNA-Thr(GGU) m(6)t(6)A37 methyltransferase TsaA [Aminobacter aminovorans]SUU91448.1 putative methyltransferase, YaeB/AF_0241 family [Aminobacter aminovorans]